MLARNNNDQLWALNETLLQSLQWLQSWHEDVEIEANERSIDSTECSRCFANRESNVRLKIGVVKERGKAGEREREINGKNRRKTFLSLSLSIRL